MDYAIVNLGSNLGQRRLNLSRAVGAINARFGDFEVSHVVETDPQGFDSENKFLNICLMFRTDLEPLELLHELQAIEKKICPDPHRTPDGGYADRVIDIDLIALGDRVVDTPELQLPHPRLAERRFFLQPLDEIAGAWRHPVTGLTPMQMLMNLPPEEKESDKKSEK